MLTAAEMKSALLSVAPPPPIRVPTPEWAAVGLAEVWHLPMTADDRDWYDQRDSELRFPRDKDGKELPADLRGLRSETIARVLCDAAGTLLGFTSLEVIELRRKSGAAVDRVFYSVQKSGGLLGNAVQEAEKNSAAGPCAGSSGNCSSETDDTPTS